MTRHDKPLVKLVPAGRVSQNGLQALFAEMDGIREGTRLGPVHAVNVFWFAWSDFYPETEIYGQ